MHNYEIIICYFIAYATWLVKCRYRSNISVIRRSFSLWFSLFRNFWRYVACRVGKEGLRDAKRTRLLLLSGRCALPHIRRKCFSILARIQVRAANERELYISPFLPLRPSPPGRRCLRKNQLYPAISIGLHAKTSTLYCYHRHIIRDIGTSHFPVGGRRIGSHVRANRGREADRTTNPRVCSCDIERAFTRRVSPDRCDSHKNRQPIIHGKLASQTHI